MLSLIVAIAVTVFLGVALLILLLGGKSAVVTRLTEVATVDGTMQEEAAGPAEPNQALAKALGVLAPVRKMLGMTADSDVTRRLSLAGYREPVHTDIFFGVK